MLHSFVGDGCSVCVDARAGRHCISLAGHVNAFAASVNFFRAVLLIAVVFLELGRIRLLGNSIAGPKFGSAFLILRLYASWKR